MILGRNQDEREQYLNYIMDRERLEYTLKRRKEGGKDVYVYRTYHPCTIAEQSKKRGKK